MRKTSGLLRLLLLVMLTTFSFTAITTGLSSWAQRTGPPNQFDLLDNATCVASTGIGDLRIEQQTPVIGNQLFTSAFHIDVGPGNKVSFACDIDSTSFDSLTLAVGIPDEAADYGGRMSVNIWQGGEIIHGHPNAQPGQLINGGIDLTRSDMTNPNKVSVELICDQYGLGYRCELHFVQALLSG